MNKIILSGNLTREPELQSTQSGVSLCKFTVAVQDIVANADGEKETDFFNVTAWRGLADNCGKYLAKGSKVLVVGKLKNRSYEGKDGTKKYVTDVMASEVEFLSKSKRDDSEQESSKPDMTPIDDDSELPF